MQASTETIRITFEKSHLVTIGEKLYGESLELLRELIANAYDADATEVHVDLKPERLAVRDNGSGMDEEGLREFFRIGSQGKLRGPGSPRFRPPRRQCSIKTPLQRTTHGIFRSRGRTGMCTAGTAPRSRSKNSRGVSHCPRSNARFANAFRSIPPRSRCF